METETVPSAGWALGRSIALELDTALTAVGGNFPRPLLPDDIGDVFATIPDDWLAEWPQLMGDARRSFISRLTSLAGAAGVLFEEDYSRATLAMRDLTLTAALQDLITQAQAFGLTPPPDLAPVDAYCSLLADVSQEQISQLGLFVDDYGSARQRWIKDAYQTVRYLRDGDLNTRFWLWLDRFYYEIYAPWRATRMEMMALQAAYAVSQLGADELRGVSPSIAWLPEPNPIKIYPQLQEAVGDGRLKVFFWNEPFQVMDLWVLHDDWILTSFSEAGVIFDSFRDYAVDIAERAKALADPTRLIILRLIRHLGMTNTEIAQFLNIARPTVSIHVKVLRQAGLVRSTQVGREVHHSIVSDEVRRLFADLDRFLDLYD